MISRTAQVWNQLAMVNEGAEKPAIAEAWYRKAIEGGRQSGDVLPTARALSNLANLLSSQSDRLAEAQRLAEESLAIKMTLDPGAAEIWKTYDVLTDIADQEGQFTLAREFRRLARETKRNFSGTRHELRQHAILIGVAVAVALEGVLEPDDRDKFEKILLRWDLSGWTKLVAAIRRIHSGERDVDALCEGLHSGESMVVEAILDGLKDPSTLKDLLLPTESTS